MGENAPRIRDDLEFFPVRQGGQSFVLVRDSLGLVEEGKAVPMGLYQLLIQLDGTKSARDLQMMLMRQQGGMLIGLEEVQRMLLGLDASFFLQSNRFHEAKNRLVVQFSREPVRPCAFSGRSYPGEPGPLSRELDEILNLRPPSPGAEAPVRALVAPHIDLKAGAGVYASAYRALEKASPSRVVVLGVGHHMREGLFCLTEKDFETPLGTVRNDRASVRTLRGSAPAIVSEGDFVHRSEHSIEFQVILLQHVLRRRPFTIVPILCGALESSLARFDREGYRDTAAGFHRALSELASDEKGETLLVAGVDLSHTGPKFGHRETGGQLQAESEAHDRKLTRAVSSVDPDAFWQERIAAGDRFNV